MIEVWKSPNDLLRVRFVLIDDEHGWYANVTDDPSDANGLPVILPVKSSEDAHKYLKRWELL